MRRRYGLSGFVAVALSAMTSAPPIQAQAIVEMPAQDRALAGDFEEVFRIGSFEGEVWETFGQIGGVAFDAAGNLYILDRQASSITMVDRAGDFVRVIGSPGEGPGEFRQALQFTAMRDGRLVVADLGHRAYQLFGPDGEFERMVGMGGGGMIRVGDLSPDPSGDAVISGGGGVVMRMARGGPGSGPAEPTTRPIDRISLSGSEADASVIVEGWLPPRGDETQRMEGGGMSFSMSSGPRTFEPQLLLGALPDGGVAFSDSSTYAIKIVGAAGGISRVLRRPFRPEAVSERMQDAERERQLAESEAGAGPQMRIMTANGGGAPQAVSQDAIREMMRGRIEQMQFYSELPVLMDLQTSWTGKIWAQRRGSEPTEPGPIDVMTAEGQYMGSLDAEDTVMPDAFGPNGLAAYIEADDLEIPVVVVRRLPAVMN